MWNPFKALRHKVANFRKVRRIKKNSSLQSELTMLHENVRRTREKLLLKFGLFPSAYTLTSDGKIDFSRLQTKRLQSILNDLKLLKENSMKINSLEAHLIPASSTTKPSSQLWFGDEKISIRCISQKPGGGNDVLTVFVEPEKLLKWIKDEIRKRKPQ